MDPLECLKNANKFYNRGDHDEVLRLLNAYRVWRENGGFEPTDEMFATRNGEPNGDEVAEGLYKAVKEDLTDKGIFI